MLRHRRSLDWGIDRLESLNARYRGHRLGSREPGFVWGGSARSEPLRRIVGGPGKRVLDLGCRTGALTQAYAAGNDVVGIDADREALVEAAASGIETVWADVEEPLPFDDATFDVVIAAELLEHLHSPNALMTEIARVLRPGGTIAGSVPNAYRLKNRLRSIRGRPVEQDSTHVHLFRPSDLLSLLRPFEAPRLEFVVGRFVRVSPRRFANVIVFSARKPG
jgi:2-polyprenyl-3-methyl-5-hydroxy-6-metoxy-1,4-benzoquinol methylase